MKSEMLGWGLVLSLFLSQSSHADIRIGANVYPDQVDHSDQFAPETQTQTGGTCHIFAAAAVYEAACKRITGKVINVSEAYMTYRHLRWQVNSRVAYFENYNPDLSRKIFNKGVDGGRPDLDLEGLLSGYVASEKEFPFSSELTSKTMAVGVQGSEYEKKYGRFAGQDRFREYTNQQMDQFVKGVFDKNRVKYFRDDSSAKQLYVPITADADIRSCQRRAIQMRVTYMPTLETMIRILSRGFPLLCTGHYALQESDYKRTAAHVSTVVGYRYNERFPKNIEFKFRDSNQKFMTWGWGFKKFSCQSLVWLE